MRQRNRQHQNAITHGHAEREKEKGTTTKKESEEAVHQRVPGGDGRKLRIGPPASARATLPPFSLLSSVDPIRLRQHLYADSRTAEVRERESGKEMESDAQRESLLTSTCTCTSAKRRRKKVQRHCTTSIR